jgi:hypothetical protein
VVVLPVMMPSVPLAAVTSQSEAARPTHPLAEERDQQVQFLAGVDIVAGLPLAPAIRPADVALFRAGGDGDDLGTELGATPRPVAYLRVKAR